MPPPLSQDADANRTVSPLAGRMVSFTSGFEVRFVLSHAHTQRPDPSHGPNFPSGRGHENEQNQKQNPHQVQPVVSGNRYALSVWFTTKPENAYQVV